MRNLHAAALGLCLSGVFNPGALVAEPILLEASDSPFVKTVHGCTQDDTLMEVRVSFDLDPYYARDHLNTEAQHDAALGKINEFIADTLQLAWQQSLEGITFAQIENGAERPLKNLLTTLYSFTDESFKTVDMQTGSHNVMPVLRGGGFQSDHILCVD